ncbi:group II intron maturase-specific domain-containing protein [Enterococcus faecium]|nr:group II intron maturase-specific domain-containing protein [Enterococcus faecium]MDQ8341202.1 group II intron maturase-specific domain-containing protein [Enterococcus faecium]MDQ8348420.1 group II intron maturase-specific domain-containing protein [Enterococcus faecium]MDQ8525968.1 group II intron maturase-specific domain-containing protein [Enterococcus faecium]
MVVHRVLQSVTVFIEKKLGLIVNVEKSRIGCPNETQFLGFSFYFDKHTKKYQPKIHEEFVQKFHRKLRQLTKSSKSISPDVRIVKLKQVICDWGNYFRKAKIIRRLAEIDAKL